MQDVVLQSARSHSCFDPNISFRSKTSSHAFATHPTRNPVQEPMEHMFPTQDRMPPHPPQEILQRPHPPGNDRRVLFRLARPLDSIVREGLFGWDRRDDEDGVERLERGSEGVEVRVPVVRLSVLVGVSVIL